MDTAGTPATGNAPEQSVPFGFTSFYLRAGNIYISFA